MSLRFQSAILVAAAALSISCVHQTLAGNSASKPAAPPITVWDRQVRNAVDAGDGDYQLRALREKISAEPDNIAARVELSKAYGERGFHEVALEISRLAVARFPESGDAELSLVRDLRAVNRRPEAIVSLEIFLKANPASEAKFYSWLGILRDESGLWPLGEPAHRKALELAATMDSLHNNLGYNLLMQKKNQEAAAEFEEALKLNPASAIARNNLGMARARAGQPAQALAAWQAASDPATAHNNLAAVWIEKGNYTEARSELQQALGYNKSHSAALKNLELVASLETLPPAAPSKAGLNNNETRWERWKIGFRKLFVGPLENSRPEAPKNASAVNSEAKSDAK
jgi:tetratricopeptide (TPR) repeat protein